MQELREYLEARGVVIGPKQWPGGNLTRQPGDFRLLYDPIAAAPITDPAGGGIVHFGSIDRASFDGLVDLLAIGRGFDGGVAVFISTVLGAARQRERRYLAQLRAVSGSAMERDFGAKGLWEGMGQPQALLRQGLNLEELLWNFVLHQQAYWGTSFADGRAPAGALGGDGEDAREQLAFGLMAEQDGICRIWSRAWLVNR